ncbi:hydrogenase expression/formation protein HypC [Kribbella sp. VKM Ac-2571]|jgi:hydrogenase expression/formation protein HypC|uniref:HypC/HybG/HupF family hydrogenase formation chaperone n=1 Tax=Kribbella sp. VKM Ac-2571 TaxID=2512222 RepID=UPI00105B81DA|nr:HypC/HybG/HupF family hydrogenase formation chaperone [Kribbella sp. VKM Ac-2571]TDO58755.1 hydrogenase expression/formation protein HypC [Kribbella sp. VKM Ac-2571]
MCIGIVGRVVELDGDAPPAAPTGTVDTEEGRRQVCFAFLPDAAVGELVLVHSGFAVNRLDDRGAER